MADDPAEPAENRQPGGRFGPGNRANPGGRPKMSPEVREAFERMTPLAVAKLEQLMGSDDERVALSAAQTILDRHLGKATQAIEHSGADGGPLTVTVKLVKS